MNEVTRGEWSSDHFTSLDGKTEIFFKSLCPKESKKIHFICIHDLGHHHGQFRELAKFLEGSFNQAKISLIDLKGHGLSSGSRGHISHFKTYVEDIKKYYLMDTSEDELTVFITSGLGSLVFFNLSLDQELGSNIFHIACNPLVNPIIEVPRWAHTYIKMFSENLGKVKLPIHILGQDMSGDKEYQGQFNRDPLINHNFSLRMFEEIMRVSSRISTMNYYVNTNSLFLVSGQSIFCNINKNDLFLKGIPNRYREIKRYKGKHDLFNETDRDNLFIDIKNWINQRVLNEEN